MGSVIKKLICPQCDTKYSFDDFGEYEAECCKICNFPFLDEVEEEIEIKKYNSDEH